VKIAGSAFIGTSITSLTARGFSATGSLFMHVGEIVRYLGTPKSVVIPSTVREIGEDAFDSVELVDLRFEEGVERIKFAAFAFCDLQNAIVFPASLVTIDERAFDGCEDLREVTFTAGSKLQYIGKDAFRECPLKTVLLPANFTEMDPSAFYPKVWRILTFDGPSPILVSRDFVCSPDSRTMLKCLVDDMTIEIPAQIEVIGKNAFRYCFLDTVIFANGSRLREIGKEAFCNSEGLSTITLPSSVEILGDRCFMYCVHLTIVTFGEISNLKRVGERAFAFSSIHSITIPASTNEIDGSAFAGCALEMIDIAPGNRRFFLTGNTLLTSDGTEIVKSFGMQQKIFVPREVEILQTSSFESLSELTELRFESESKLRRIGRSALSGCDSLRRILLPASVSEIEEFAFKECIGLEDCSIQKNAILMNIGKEAFAGCSSLRSFYVPKNVERIGESCFNKCPSLYRLKFASGETLKIIVRDRTLDEALEHIGVTYIWSLFQIEVEEDGSDLSFPGWVSLADESSHLTFTRDFS
jgi:hypothetical protein